MRAIDAPPERGEIASSFTKHYAKLENTNKILSHPYSEIIVISRGDVVYASGGRVVRLGDKSVIYNRAGAIHNNYVQESRIYERYRIKFYEDDLLRSDPNASVISEALSASFTKELREEDFSLLWELARGIDGWAEASTDIERVCRQRALSLLLLRASAVTDRGTFYSKSYISDVIDYLNAHLSEKLTLDGVATSFFVSRGKLIYDFKAYCNISINEYVTMARLERSKELLAKGYSVSAVSELCGFSSPSYFIKVFSRIVGTTPLKYGIAFGKTK